MDFSADGRYLIASCEFGGAVIKVDVESQKLVGLLRLEKGGMPQDVKLSPDGHVFYVADMMANGVYMIDGDNLTKTGFIKPARARMACMSAETPNSFTYRTGGKAAFRSSILPRAPWSRNGSCLTAAARTWVAFPPTARCYGCRDVTTPKSTPSTRPTAICWRAFRLATVRTDCASIHSRAGTRWGTRACSGRSG